MVEQHTADVSLKEAAALLNIPLETAKKRAQRGQIQAYKDPSGKWRVILPAPGQFPGPAGQMTGTLPGNPSPTQAADLQTLDAIYRELIETLRSERDFLRQELEQRDQELEAKNGEVRDIQAQLREALQQKDSIIMALSQKVPAPALQNQPAEEPAPQHPETESHSTRWWQFWKH